MLEPYFLPASLNHLTEGLLITESRNLSGAGPRILYVNSAIESMTGYSASELIGQTPRIFQCPETDRTALDRMRSALEDGRPVTEVLVNARKDGIRILVEMKIVPERDCEGNIIRFVSIQRNITDIVREQRERQLQDSSLLLLFDENPTPMYVLDINTLRILRTNDAWRQSTGYDQETSLRLRCTDIRPDVAADILAASIREDASSGRLSGPYRFVGRDGRTFPAMAMRRVITYEGCHAIISTLWDVTELEAARAQAQDTLRRLEQISAILATRTKDLSDAQRLAKVGSWLWDHDQRHLLFSPETWQLLGSVPSGNPVSYEQLRSMLHPDDYQKSMDTYYRAIKDQISVSAEYRVNGPDGNMRHMLTFAEPIVEQNRVTGLRGTTQDITEIRSMEYKLRASEDHYRHMVDLHPQIPWTAEPNGGVIEAGAKWFALTGMSADDSFPHGWTKAVHPLDLENVVAEWSRSLSKLSPLDIEFRIRDAQSQFIWVRVRAAVRLDQRGCPLRWYGTMEDITDRKNAEEAKRKSEMLAAQVLDATSDAVLVLNADLEVKFCNATAKKLFGDRVRNQSETLPQLLQIRRANALPQAVCGSFRSQKSNNIEFFWKPGDIWLDIHIRPDAEKISLFMRDVSDQKRAQRQLQYAARHDALTGAPNRVLLFEQLDSYLIPGTHSDRIALMCLDLDFFKEVNDTLGHPAGDTVLKLVVNRLRSHIRSSDLLARTGGDEFMILQTGIQSCHDVELLAERVVSAMRHPFQIDGREVQIGVSVGLAISDGSHQTSSDIYKQADLALYAVKLNNRGGYQFFELAMDTEVRLAREFRSDLAGALQRGEFSVEYQPIVRTADEAIIGAEALLRWRHPERGNVSPAQFIRLAEESGYIIEIGQWVLQEACCAAQGWPAHMSLSVNVSPKQIERGNFITVIDRALELSGLAPQRLLIEVTESLFFSSTDSVQKAIIALSERGIRIVLDDFGTGYSSLAYLDTFDFRKIKIDRSFISRIDDHSQSMPILEAIMGLAHGLGLSVTAEGVETRAQLQYLKRIKCHEVQGYLFGRSMSNIAFTTIVSPDYVSSTLL